MAETKKQWTQYVPLAWIAGFLACAFVPAAQASRALLVTIVSVSFALAAWYLLLQVRTRTSCRPCFGFEFVPIRTHYVQASVQFCIYVTWGWYWPKVYAEAPLIASQIFFLYSFSALMSWSLGRTWKLGFGVFPIVFSTNFFLWFYDDWFIFQYLMLAAGALAKELIVWERDGRRCHIFNPSAFGLSVFSLALILTNTSQFTWGWEIASTLGRPPFIYLQVFLLGLVVQGLFRVTLMTFSATATLVLLNFVYTQATGVYFFVDANIPIAVFLGSHLLVTDPATTPRSFGGKAIFGCLYGAGVWVCFAVLRDFNLPEYYDKLLVVPFLNLGVKIIDWISSKSIGELWSGPAAEWSPARVNLAVMALWIAFFLSLLGTGYVQAPHPGASISFWEKAAVERRPHATENLISKLSLLSYDGNAEASRELVRIYSEGRIIAPNPVLAEKFRIQAASVELNGVSPSVNAAALQAKLTQLLAQGGKDIDVPYGLSTPLGLTTGQQSWPSCQIAGSLGSRPGEVHSISRSRLSPQSDLLFAVHSQSNLILLRSRPDFVLVRAESIDLRSGNHVILSPQYAQDLLASELAFWFQVTDHLPSAPALGKPVITPVK